jgi:hypothetical protein
VTAGLSQPFLAKEHVVRRANRRMKRRRIPA